MDLERHLFTLARIPWLQAIEVAKRPFRTRAMPPGLPLLAGMLALVAASNADAQQATCPPDYWSCDKVGDGKVPPDGCDPLAAMALEQSCKAAAEKARTNDTLAGKVESLEKDLAQARLQASTSSQELALTTKRLGSLEETLRATQASLNISQQQKRELEAQLAHLDQAKAELESEKKHLQESVTKLVQEKAVAEESLKQAQTAYKESSTQQRDEARRKLAAAQAARDKIEASLKQARGDLTQKQSSLLSVSSKVEDLEKKNAALTARVVETSKKEEEAKKAAEAQRKSTLTVKLLLAGLVAAVFAALIFGFARLFTNAKRDQTTLQDRFSVAAGHTLSELDKAALDDFARLYAIAGEARMMLKVTVFASLLGAFLAITTIIVYIASAEDTNAALTAMQATTLWQIFVGFATPTGALLAIYSIVQTNLNAAMDLCRELGIFQRGNKSDEASSALASQRGAA